MLEIRFHGRGGQGAVTSVELVALAAISGGRYAQAFPSFGPERRGAPVLAFLRLSDEPIKIRADIKQPDVVIVLDPSLLRIVKVTAGLKDGGTVIVNTKKSLAEIKQNLDDKYRIAVVDASSIALKTLGVPITNTTMIGALLKATEIITLESLTEPLKHRFGLQADKNVQAMRQAYEQTQIAERQNG
jgi:pyruvate ferredoxin oxidoreductase gamma subunit